jgi:competence protein ComEC
MKLNTLFILFILIIVTSGCLQAEPIQKPTTSTIQNSNLTVRFIDVGQGDSELIEYNGSAILIDAAESDKSSIIENYIKKDNVKLKYVVTTHPHADHIGGMSTIIRDFPIDYFILNNETHTTKTYTSMLSEISQKNIKTIIPKRDANINFDKDIDVKILNPGTIYLKTDAINQNSIVLKVIDQNISFLFMGDAGVEAEEDMLKDNCDVKSDILKVGHHGSHTASSQGFINACKPSIAIVSVGRDNSYGLPDEEPLARIQAVASLYRTDENGTITVTTDGKNYSVITEKS